MTQSYLPFVAADPVVCCKKSIYNSTKGLVLGLAITSGMSQKRLSDKTTHAEVKMYILFIPIVSYRACSLGMGA